MIDQELQSVKDLRAHVFKYSHISETLKDFLYIAFIFRPPCNTPRIKKSQYANIPPLGRDPLELGSTFLLVMTVLTSQSMH